MKSALTGALFYFVFIAFLNSIPDNADIPPTSPPISAVINNISIQCGSWNKWVTFLTRIWSLGILLSKASIIQAMATPPKPDQKDRTLVLLKNAAARNAITATDHQGKTKPARNDKINIMMNSILCFFKSF